VNGEQLPLLTRRRLGEGELWYLAAKLGLLAYEPEQFPPGTSRGGYQPPADARAVDLIGRIAELILGDAPHFAIEGAPTGLLNGLYRTERDGRSCRALHLLNCTGRGLDAGDPVAFPSDQPLPMPPLPELRVYLPGRVGAAVLASPELAEPMTLSVASDGEVSVVTVPAQAFGTYGVIWAYD